MRFTIKREELLKALNIASRGIASKTPVPVLSNYKLELTEDGLYITGSNFDLTIRTQIPYRRGEEELIRNYKEGSTLINAKIITEFVRKMDSDEITVDVIDSTIATIGDKRSEYKLNCVRPEEYPDLDLEASGAQLTLSTKDFDTLVNQTAFAASTKEQRPILTAVNLDASNGVLTATATDSARLARKTMAIRQDIGFVANIPAKMLVEVSHLVSEYPSVDLAVSDKKAIFQFGYTLVATRLIAGDYPNTRNIVPKISNYTLEVNAQDLIKAIDRAKILTIERENVVDLSMDSESVEISAKSSQVGSAVENIEIFRFEGDSLKVSFNSEFVCQAIKSLNSQDVIFSFVGEMKPFVIKNASDDSVVQVVTPCKTY
jgi:DNA polymerase-3 subunit beta